MGLFDFFRKQRPKSSEASGDVPLEQSCYDVAYFILPGYVFQDLPKLVDLCVSTPAASGPFFYVMACQAREIEPDTDAAGTFQWHQGTFDGSIEYLALEYPQPPPVDMGEGDPMAMLESGVKMVLAPYYSVILHGAIAQPEYYILGQAPIGGGTTVRQIIDGGANCNLGPGPAPEFEAFLDAIRQRRMDREA